MEFSKSTIIVFSVTFVLFFIEALVHYNVGLNAGKPFALANLSLPEMNELVHIVVVLAVFSGLDTYLSPLVQKWVEDNKVSLE